MKKLIALLFLATTIGLYSCESSNESNENVENNEDNTTTEDTLLIEVDTQTISIDNSEVATFSVTLDGEDVTSQSQIINITDGGYEVLSSNTFTTFRPGTHTFYAEYGSKSSDKIAINATSESNLSSTYYRRNIVLKFTATWCTNCPAMTSAIEAASKLYPDRLIEVAAHVSDDYQTTTTATYYTTFGIANYGLPTVVIDMNSDYTIVDKTYSKIISDAQQSMADNPTVAGIKVNTEYADDKLYVDVESTFVADNNYKILVLILQSGYEYGGDTYDHLVFAPLTEAMGDSLGDLVIGEKIQRSYEFDYKAELGYGLSDTSLTDVVVCIFNEVSEGRYAINNAVSCNVGESMDYQFEPVAE